MRVLLRLIDPWEMGEQLGWPAIPATVVREADDVWLVEIDRPFDYGDANYRFLVISPRHPGEQLAEHGALSVICNMIRTTEERASSASPCDTSWWRGGHSMIGSVEVAQGHDAGDVGAPRS